MMQKQITRVLDRITYSDSYYVLVLENPFDTEIQPGQFVMISIADIHDPFLKRPYSIFKSFNKSQQHPKGEIHLLIKNVGKGSDQMSKVSFGSKVDIIGPLGKPFTVENETEIVVFIAGGVGVAPFVEFASSELLRNKKKIMLIGGRSAEDIQAVKDLEELGVEVFKATEDGSLGTKGRVTVLLESMIAKGLESNTQIYACGPEPMMKAVGKITSTHNLPCQLSLEARMGCGFGVCLGCVVKDKDGHYIRVCKEGPVINASDLADFKAGETNNE